MSRNANGNINHLPCKHDPININEIHVFFRVLQKILYRENSKMRFPWYRDNGKIAIRLIRTLECILCKKNIETSFNIRLNNHQKDVKTGDTIVANNEAMILTSTQNLSLSIS